MTDLDDFKAVEEAIRFTSQRRFHEAISILEPIIARRPEWWPARQQITAPLSQSGRHDDALHQALETLCLAPENPYVQWNASVLLLVDGQWDKAASLTHAGYRTGHRKPRCVKWPAVGYDGWSTPMFLWNDQGRGDLFANLRFAIAIAAEDHYEIGIETPPEMASLLKAQKWAQTGDIHIIEMPGDFSEPTGYDDNASISDIPFLLNAMPGSIPGPQVCIKSDPMQGLDAGPKVGVCLEGNPNMGNDFLRTPPKEAGLPIIHAIEKLARVYLLTDHSIWQSGDPILKTYADTAAMISAVDLVVTTDTSVAHLAGCMGKRTVLILSAYPDWRFGRAGHETGWYGNMREVRQARMGNWSNIVGDTITVVKEELAAVHGAGA